MTRYGQFCPVAKATEILGDSWSLLIVRELLLGTNRFNGFQRALSRISPTVLNKRLKALEEHGILIRKRISGQRGHTYHLTAAGRELGDVVTSLAVWGMRWARDAMAEDELDVSLLMIDIQRRIRADLLPDGETVICFSIKELSEFNNWWIVNREGDVDLCYEDPGKDVDLYVSGDARDLIGVWMGDQDLREALRCESITLVGNRHLSRTFGKWFALSSAAEVERPAPDGTVTIQ